MSRILSGATAASLGSFVINHRSRSFSPSGAGMEAPRPINDTGDALPEDAVMRIQDEAYAQGYEDARRAAEQELGAAQEAVRRLAESLEVLRPEPSNALALLLAETVDRLVRDICGQVDVDGTLLLARAREAAALIGENVEPSRLRLHPEDAALINGAELPVELLADPSLSRGTLRLETGHGWIEDGPQVRLERLRTELDKLAAPR